MTKQLLRIICLFSLLAVFAIFAIGLSSADPMNTQTEPLPRIPASNVTSASLMATLPFTGWLALDFYDDYAQAEHQPELDIGPANGSFTIEGWVKNPFFYRGTGTGSWSSYAIYKRSSFAIIFSETDYFDVYNPPYDIGVFH